MTGKPTAAATETATLGGGCFWCIEAIFQNMRGVLSVFSGFAGGNVPQPTYEQVCGGATGHAEVVQVEFDPAQISYRELLEVFFHLHDPTTLNRQGNDVGTCYRSIVLFHDQQQKAIAEESIKAAEAEEIWDGKIVTEVVPFTEFYRAERYHQNYYADHTTQPYCSLVIAPKLHKLWQKFGDRLNVR